jgi:single-stranded-DNA-specific exonuclease
MDDRLVQRISSALRVHSVTARCLVARGMTEPQDARGFVDPRLAALRPPAGLAGMTAAVSRVADAVVCGERIGVFGDYDVDGVTTAALLTSFLRASGASVEAAVARRDAGYGFTAEAAAEFARRGCTLVVTGDCGTSDFDALAAAASHGIEVIVIDHHTVPAAGGAHPSLALVNPFRQDSTFPFRGMASVGLAFYVAASVRTELRDRGWYRNRPEPDVRDLLDLVALGTVADLVPLTEENRILTSLGLRRLQSRSRPGIAALLASAGVEADRAIDSDTIAWKLAPRLNAPGRLGAAEPALALLLAEADSAAARATEVETANQRRREVQERVMGEVLAKLHDDGVCDSPGAAIVVAGESWPTGVVGIIASKLVDKFRRPAFVIGVDPATGVGRGSARTVPGVNLYEALRGAAPHLQRYGGHAAAAGFTVELDAVPMLAQALSENCARLAEGSAPVTSLVEVDAEVGLEEVDERLAGELSQLGPFGQHNPAPLLIVRRARVTAVRRVGNGSHLKLTVQDDRASRDAIGFGLGDRSVDVGARVDLAFAPRVSTWQGRCSTELELSDLAVVS